MALSFQGNFDKKLLRQPVMRYCRLFIYALTVNGIAGYVFTCNTCFVIPDIHYIFVIVNRLIKIKA